jgi:GNAT superfamily N-acetyltransferase
MQVNIKIIKTDDILTIIPLLKKNNTKTSHDLLNARVLEMANLSYCECVGLFVDDKLSGISGLWYSIRYYIGKTVEPDHVVIDEVLRGKGLDENFFKWIDEYVKSKGCEAIELNTFVSNPKSHKFYYNEGYNIFGFQFLKVLRKDKKFY